MTTPETVIGIDVGGTFTDVFTLNEATGAFRVAKVPSTRGSEERGVLGRRQRGGRRVPCD